VDKYDKEMELLLIKMGMEMGMERKHEDYYDNYINLIFKT